MRDSPHRRTYVERLTDDSSVARRRGRGTRAWTRGGRACCRGGLGGEGDGGGAVRVPSIRPRHVVERARGEDGLL